MLTLCEQVTDTLNSLVWPRPGSQTAQLTSTSSLCKWRMQIIACFILLLWCLGADGRKWTRLEATKWDLCKTITCSELLPLLTLQGWHSARPPSIRCPCCQAPLITSQQKLLSGLNKLPALSAASFFKEATQSPIIHGERWVSPPKSRCTELLFLKNALNSHFFVWQGRRLGCNKLCL